MMTNTPPDALARTVEQLYGEMAKEFYLFSTHFLKASEILAELTSYYKDVTQPGVVPHDEPVPGYTAPMPIQSVQDEPPAAISLQEVRHRLTLAAQVGYDLQIKALLARYGAVKLSDVAPALYQSLLADLEDLMKSEVTTSG